MVTIVDANFLSYQFLVPLKSMAVLVEYCRPPEHYCHR